MKFAFACTVSLFLSGACFAGGTLWTVDDDGQQNPNADFNNIQAAVNAASDGDEIHVYPGLYTGQAPQEAVVDMLGKSLRLIGDPNAMPTIDGQGKRRGITCENGETDKTIIEGFIITNGNAMFGGGMLIESSATTLLNCTFVNNFGSSGGGLSIRVGGIATIASCTFTDNTGGIYAGGMSCIENGDATLLDCLFTNNTAQFLAGGVLSGKGSNTSFVNCAFVGNDGGLGGGGMLNDNSTLTMTNCSFTGNTSDGLGGGGMYNNNCTSTMTNCLFTDNTSKDGDGGGMYNYSSSPTLTNCTFSGNSGSSGGGIYGSATLTDCVFFDNTSSSGGKSIHASDAFFFGTNSAEGIFGRRLTFGAESLNEVSDYITWSEDDSVISFDIDVLLNTTASLESPNTIELHGPLSILNDSQSLLGITDDDEGLIIPLIQANSLGGSFDSAVMPLMPEGFGLQLTSPNISRGSENLALEVIKVEGMQFADPFAGDLNSPPLDMESFDADGDGRDEVAILFDSVPRIVAVFSISEDGPPSLIDGFTATVGNNSVDLDVGDLNGDERDDLLVANGTDQTMSVLLTIVKSDGLTFGVQHISCNGPVTSVAVIDWDGDEDLDAVVGLSSPTGYQVFLDVASQFSSGPWFETMYCPNPDGCVAEDLVPDPPTCVDGGDQVSSWGFVGGTQHGQVHRAIQDGSLQVVAKLGEAGAGQNVLTIQALELDDDGGDGQIDLIAFSREAQAAYLFQGSQSQNDGFGSPIPLAIAEDMTDALILDPDSDGDMDILLAVPDSDTPLLLLRNDGTTNLLPDDLDGRTWSKEIVDSVNEVTRIASGGLEGKDDEDDWIVGGGSSTAFRGEVMGVLEQTNISLIRTCPSDFNGDGVVDVNDLLVLIAAWGLCDACPEDINADGIVDVNDLLLVIAAWGTCK